MTRPLAAALAILVALVVAVVLTLRLALPAYAEDESWALTGKASHYGPGNGAAMPFCTWTLRHTEGCGWVAVTSLQTGVRVVVEVIDWCECVVPGSGSPYRVVDLQYDVVEALGLNLEAGLYDVTVERVGDVPALPNTAVGGTDG